MKGTVSNYEVQMRERRDEARYKSVLQPAMSVEEEAAMYLR